MKEGISKYATPFDYPGNSWIGRDSDLSNESIVGAISCPASEDKNYRYQIGYKTSLEVSEVEDPVPSTRMREGAKTLEGDLLVSYGWLSGGESGCNIILKWSPTEGTDISARRIQFPAMQDRGTEEWPVTLEFEDIANDVCIEFCNARGLISDLRKCLNEAKTIFSNIKNISAEYDCFPADEYEEDGHVVIEIEVSSDQDTAFREYDAYTIWMLDNISDDNLGFFFVTVRRNE